MIGSRSSRPIDKQRLIGSKILLSLLSFFLLLACPAQASDFANRFTATDPPQKILPLVFEDAHHAQHALSDERGHYVLLNIWATWCSPCVKEMPSLDALQKNFDIKKLRVLPLSEDRGDAVVTAFYMSHNIKNLPVAIDHAGTVTSALHLRGLPTTLLIDPQGNEIARLEGDADWNSPDIAAYLKNYIK